MIHHLIFTLNINIWSMETPSANGHLSLVWYIWCFCWEPAPIPWHSSGLCLTSFTSWPRATPHSAPSTQQAAIWGRIPLTCFEPSYFKWWLLAQGDLGFLSPPTAERTGWSHSWTVSSDNTPRSLLSKSTELEADVNLFVHLWCWCPWGWHIVLVLSLGYWEIAGLWSLCLSFRM